jgi:hypothetical protein
MRSIATAAIPVLITVAISMVNAFMTGFVLGGFPDNRQVHGGAGQRGERGCAAGESSGDLTVQGHVGGGSVTRTCDRQTV